MPDSDSGERQRYGGGGSHSSDLTLEEAIRLVPNISPKLLRKLFNDGWKIRVWDAPNLMGITRGAQSNTGGNTDLATKTIHLAGPSSGHPGTLSHELVHAHLQTTPAPSMSIFTDPARAMQSPNVNPLLKILIGSGGMAAYGQRDRMYELHEKYPMMLAGGQGAGMTWATAPQEFKNAFPGFLTGAPLPGKPTGLRQDIVASQPLFPGSTITNVLPGPTPQPQQALWSAQGSQILPLIKKKVESKRKTIRSAGRIHRR